MAGIKNYLKKAFCLSASAIGSHRLFRYRNRYRLLVLMYHGVVGKKYQPPIWMNLEQDVFRSQMLYLQKHYELLTLEQFIAIVEGNADPPPNSALITFDDGLKNNFLYAYPILKQLQIPATIFLTVDYIGTDHLFWVDRLYLYMKEAAIQNINIADLSPLLERTMVEADGLHGKYVKVVSLLKRLDAELRLELLDLLEHKIDVDWLSYRDDFGLMSWSDVKQMDAGGLVDFGVHTATHRILTNLTPEQFAAEILAPKQSLENILQKDIDSFCYPNGKFQEDFHAEHVEYLASVGYRCAFSTDEGLHDIERDSPFMIKRIAVGNDLTSDACYFKLNVSGAMSAFKKLSTSGDVAPC